MPSARSGQQNAVPDGFVVPYYLSDRKLRISVARVGDHLYTFDDLCTCAAPHPPANREDAVTEGVTRRPRTLACVRARS